MSEQIECAQRYMTAYGAGDQEQVAACLTDDVVWEIHGHERLVGKEAYLAEMRRGEGSGRPVVTPERYVEDGDTVVVLGKVIGALPDGGSFHAVFSDVFIFRDGLARVIESYVVPLSGEQFADLQG